MPDTFDPYYEWLEIPPTERPPSAYDLVGVEEGETDLNRIQDVAAERIEEVRKLTLGPQREHAFRLLNEVSEALASLLKAGAEDAAEIKKPPPEPTRQVDQPMEDAVSSSSASGPATDDGLDPYYTWIGIPPAKRLPSPHDILEIDEGETNSYRIRQAAAARRERVGRLILGPQREYAIRLLKDISEALEVLTKVDAEDTADIKKPPSPVGFGSQPAQPARPPSEPIADVPRDADRAPRSRLWETSDCIAEATWLVWLASASISGFNERWSSAVSDTTLGDALATTWGALCLRSKAALAVVSWSVQT